MSLVDFNLTPFEDGAKRANDLLATLGPVERELVVRILGVIGAHHLLRAADREKIRQALRALAFCSGAAIAANGEDAVKAKLAFDIAVSTTITRSLPR